MKSFDQHRGSFVIRIWWEEANGSPGGQRLWRGWVQHIRSGEETYVQSLEGLLDFIERWTGKLSNPGKPAARLR